jgi:hypothetical protein
MIDLDVGAYLLRAVVATLAILLARRRVQHRPVALFLTLDAALDALRFYVVRPLYLPFSTPYTGVPRFWFHVGEAIFTLWPVGIACLCTVVFLRRRPWWPMAVGALALATLVAGYPHPFRGDTLGKAYAVIDACAVAWSLTGVAIWTLQRRRPRPEHACASLLALIDISLFAGPFMPPAPHPFDSWVTAQAIYAMVWAMLALVHVGAIWFNFLSSRSALDSSLRFN